MTYDLSREVGDRVVKVLVRCSDCDIPEFVNLDNNKMYTIAMPNFIADGGDGYDAVANNAQNRYSGRTLIYQLGLIKETNLET